MMKEIKIKQTCFYKLKVSDDDFKSDIVLENINVHPMALLEDAELFDLNTILLTTKGEE